MPTLSLNSTGRSRITLDMFELALENRGPEPSIDIKWDLSKLALESSTKLYLDASNDRLEARFGLAAGDTSSGFARVELGGAFAGRLVRIRVIAVVNDENGIPIIRAESVPVSLTTSGDSSSKSLLVVQPVVDLPVPWKLSFEGGDIVMMVANKGDLWTSHLRNEPFLKPFVVGPVVFQVAMKLLSGSEDLGAGLEQWEKLLQEHGLDVRGAGAASFDEIIELAEEVSLSFQTKAGSLDRLIKSLEEASK